jgi:hypothetical protein
MRFKPVLYLSSCEIEEYFRLRKKINDAKTLTELERYERKIKNMIRVAFVRFKTRNKEDTE